MCGISGIFRRLRDGQLPIAECVARMTSALAHRGPDANAIWTGEGARICFGHRRLAIQDLSAAGAQPMHSDCGRLSVTYNGEIYNHFAIRSELEAAGAAPAWRGH